MNLVAFIVVFVTVYVAVQVFFVQLSTGVQTVSATPIPKYWLNAGLIAGLSVASLEFLLQVVRSDTSHHGAMCPNALPVRETQGMQLKGLRLVQRLTNTSVWESH